MLKKCIWNGIVWWVAALTIAAQTRVNIQSQASGIDFLKPPFASPLRSGGVLPGTCVVGELYFLTTAPPGSNLQVCHASGQWAPQGSAGQGTMEVQNDGVSVGVRPVLNYVPAPGILQVIADYGSRIDVQSAIDTATVQTKAAAQSGAALRCVSTAGVNLAYSCTMSPLLTGLSAGMLIHWQPDVDNTGGGITLEIDSLNPKPVRLADGVTEPRPGDFQSGRTYPLWYDGAVFRVVESPTLQDYQTENEDQTGRTTYCASGGASGTAYTCSLVPVLDAYSMGMLVRWRPDVDSAGGPVTLEIDSLGSRSVFLRDGITNPIGGEIRGGELYLLWFDGVAFRMVASLPRGNVSEGTVQSGALLLCVSDSASETSYACPLDPLPGNLTTGAVFHWVPDIDAIPGGVTLNIGELGATPVTRSDGVSNPRDGEIKGGRMYQIWYDGASFRLLSVADAVNLDASAVPVCNEELRGRLSLVPGAATVKDEMFVCAKDENDQFAWRLLY